MDRARAAALEGVGRQSRAEKAAADRAAEEAARRTRILGEGASGGPEGAQPPAAKP